METTHHLDHIDADRAAAERLNPRAQSLGADSLHSHPLGGDDWITVAMRGPDPVAYAVVIRDAYNRSIAVTTTGDPTAAPPCSGALCDALGPLPLGQLAGCSALEQGAALFAAVGHARHGDRRKYTGTPYIVHPAAVADIVREAPHSEAMLAAAWLHDVVEHGIATLEQLVELFGLAVAALVEMVSDVSTPADGNRKARKALDRAHNAGATPAGQTIKVADVLANLGGIARRDPEFARVYLDEKAALLNVLDKANSTLRTRAYHLLEEELALLRAAEVRA